MRSKKITSNLTYEGQRLESNLTHAHTQPHLARMHERNGHEDETKPITRLWGAASHKGVLTTLNISDVWNSEVVACHPECIPNMSQT